MHPTKSSADKYLTVITIAAAFHMFIIMQNPLRFSWITAVVGTFMCYFAFQKFKFDKKNGNDIDKARAMMICGALSATVATGVIIFNLFFIE